MATVVLAGGGACANAQDLRVMPDPNIPLYRYETWTGGDATGHSWSIYGGMNASLSGDIRVDGFRLRSAAGYGSYTYTSPRWNGLQRLPKTFDGVQSYTDLAIGYQHAIGPWIVKVYVGGTQETHAILPFDTENSVQGGRRGLKGAVETWFNFRDAAFLQTEASWSQVFDTYGGRARAGYRINPAFSAGVEGAMHGNAVYNSGRLGSFARFEWTSGEISASGGLAGDRSGATGAYGSIGLLLRF